MIAGPVGHDDHGGAVVGAVTTGLRDAAAGAIATVAMSAVMIGGDRAGILGEPPPTTVTRAALREAGVEHPAEAAGVMAPLAHLWFGALGGVVFGLVRRLVPGVPGWSLGPLFGLGVYGVSYKGWIPALGILPPPEEDRPGRPAVMIAAHLVYGLALGWLIRPRKA
jgi:hypothetical protein